MYGFSASARRAPVCLTCLVRRKERVLTAGIEAGYPRAVTATTVATSQQELGQGPKRTMYTEKGGKKSLSVLTNVRETGSGSYRLRT